MIEPISPPIPPRIEYANIININNTIDKLPIIKLIIGLGEALYCNKVFISE